MTNWVMWLSISIPALLFFAAVYFIIRGIQIYNFIDQKENLEPECCTPEQCRFISDGTSTSTLAYYPPIYDSKGNNINPDRNTVTKPKLKCMICGREK